MSNLFHGFCDEILSLLICFLYVRARAKCCSVVRSLVGHLDRPTRPHGVVDYTHCVSATTICTQEYDRRLCSVMFNWLYHCRAVVVRWCCTLASITFFYYYISFIHWGFLCSSTGVTSKLFFVFVSQVGRK